MSTDVQLTVVIEGRSHDEVIVEIACVYGGMPKNIIIVQNAGESSCGIGDLLLVPYLFTRGI